MTSGAGGWRVAIIDTADDMNDAAANALLKLLEEPPSRAMLLLMPMCRDASCRRSARVASGSAYVRSKTARWKPN
ncbi:MAG: hypothetical protein WDM89_07890 [Rhizomicrobium sp.]